jgi:hypothetical protein
MTTIIPSKNQLWRCFCQNGRHRPTWWGLCNISLKGFNRGSSFLANFPNNKPYPTFDTGEWTNEECHKIPTKALRWVLE